jgi:hypothetical protein
MECQTIFNLYLSPSFRESHPGGEPKNIEVPADGLVPTFSLPFELHISPHTWDRPCGCILVSPQTLVTVNRLPLGVSLDHSKHGDALCAMRLSRVLATNLRVIYGTVS